MQRYQHDFLEFAIQANVLRFGEFTLKSGRISPYFFNAGLFNSGAALARLGRFYASAITAAKIDYDHLFGPAYKGIPLVTAISIALADQHGQDIPVSFNRKETKDHGEGGDLIGAPLAGRVVIVDDVISAGTSVRESVNRIRAAGAEPSGVVIALNRQEKGQGEHSAIAEIKHQYNMPVVAIVDLQDVIEYLEQLPEKAASLTRIKDYRQRYGE